MGSPEHITILVAIFSGLGFMAYNHNEWFMPFSSGLFHALLPVWGVSVGFSLAIPLISNNIESKPDKLISYIQELNSYVNGFPSDLGLYLIVIFVLRRVSSHVDSNKN